MPRVRFIEQNVEVEVPIGTSLLGAAQRGGAPEGSACGGVCACSTCHVYVQEGCDSLGEIADKENDIMDKAFDVRPESRLGCQCKLGDEDVIVEISEESLKSWLDENPDERKKLASGG